jgi:hypothetical protein
VTNREKRREKVVRTETTKPAAWVRFMAFSAVLALFLTGLLAGLFSK